MPALARSRRRHGRRHGKAPCRSPRTTAGTRCPARAGRAAQGASPLPPAVVVLFGVGHQEAAALAADIKRRLDAAESDESIGATASEIRNLPETLRPALRVTADKMRVALARTTERLDAIQSSEGYARHAEKGRKFLDGAVAAKREELTHHAQAPAPAE